MKNTIYCTYEYIYYKIYNFQMILWKDPFQARHIAIGSVALIQLFTLLNLLVLSLTILNISLITLFELSFAKVIFFGIAIIFLILNYKLYGGEEKLKKLKRKYRKQKTSIKIKLGILAFLNVLFVILFFVSIFVDAIFFDSHFTKMFFRNG